MKRIYAVVLALALCLGFAGCALDSLGGAAQAPGADGGGLTVHFIDVGQADAALVTCGGKAMLIDGGNVADSRTVVTYLKKQGVTELEAVVCTHGHEDHVGGLAGALNAYAARRVYSSTDSFDSKAFRDFRTYVEKQGLTLTIPQAGERFSLGSAEVELLGPQKRYTDENNNSIVLRVVYGETAFLFTGDAEREAEQELLSAGRDLRATVLKVGHHGSESSTSYPFLREVRPEYAVISVGKGNAYGHPSEQALSRLRDAAATLYRTDLQGDVVARSDGRTVTFETGKGAAGPVNPTAQPDAYIGNAKSRKFHRADCAALPAESNREYFEDRQQALDAGYQPCGSCQP